MAFPSPFKSMKHELWRGTPAARLLNGAILLLLLINLGMLVHFILYGYQVQMHSDAAVKNLLAQEIAETGSYFPPDWNYVNGDLWVLYGHTFILPLLALFRNSYRLHAFAGLVSALLLLLATWYASGVFGQSLRARLVSLLVVSTGASIYMTEVLYGEATYGIMFSLECFLLFFAWRFMEARGKGAWLWGALVTLVALLAFWASPQRGAVMYGLPFFAGMGGLLVFDLHHAGWRLQAPVRRNLLLLLLFAAGSIAGGVLHALTLARVNNFVGLSAPLWLAFDGMLAQVVGSLRGLLALLGGSLEPGVAVTSAMGVYQVLRLLGALVLLVVLPRLLFSALDSAIAEKQRGRLLFVGFAMSLMALSLLVFLTTSIAAQGPPERTTRYLIPGLVMMLMAAVGMLVDGRPGPGLKMRIAGLLALVLLATGGFDSLTGLERTARLQPGPRSIEKRELAEFLASSGLRYGYSTFWNAGVLSVFSGQQVRIRQIEIYGLPRPMRFLSSNRWYEPQAWEGESFLLLSSAESKLIDWAKLTALAGEPVRRLQFRDWQVTVFRQNLALLPSWNYGFVQPVSFPVGPKTPHIVGSFDEGPPGTLVTQKGQAGVVHFGPYIAVPQGAYKVTFDIEASGQGVGNFGRVEVFNDEGKKVLNVGADILTAGVQQLPLNVQLEEDLGQVQFRVISNGAGQLKVFGVHAARAKAPIKQKGKE